MSLQPPASPDVPHIIDTSVLLYFFLAEEEELLGNLVGWPLTVPFAVFDPTDWAVEITSNLRIDLQSEIRQAWTYYTRLGTSSAHSGLAERIATVDRLYQEDHLTVAAMTPTEQRRADQLQSSAATDFGLRLPLGAGEAACVAIAHERDWVLVSDDSAALRVMAELRGAGNYGYERIRKLLIRAAIEGRISELEANQIHARMVSYGFWDKGHPFNE